MNGKERVLGNPICPEAALAVNCLGLSALPYLAPFPGPALVWGSRLSPHFAHQKEPMCHRDSHCFSSSASQQPSYGLSCSSGGLRTRRDCRSLPSPGPSKGHCCPAGPELRAQVRGVTAPCGRRHGHGADHRPFLPPLARPPAQEDSRRRPLAAEARLQRLSPALPGPRVRYGKCSP